MKNKTLITFLIIIAIGLIIYFATKDTIANPSHVQQDTGTSSQTESKTLDSPGVSVKNNVKEFAVTGSNFSFSPSQITVNKGDTVRITFTNDGGMHDLRIDEFGVATDRLATGETQSITFTADKVGTFEYYCSISNHRAMGMMGIFVVQ